MQVTKWTNIMNYLGSHEYHQNSHEYPEGLFDTEAEAREDAKLICESNRFARLIDTVQVTYNSPEESTQTPKQAPVIKEGKMLTRRVDNLYPEKGVIKPRGPKPPTKKGRR